MLRLLVVAASVMAALSLAAVGTCLTVRDSRVRRRRTIVGLLAARSTGPLARPRSSRVRRSIVLELADRLDGSSLREQVPWVGEVRQQGLRDLASRRWVRRARGLRALHPLGVGDVVIRAGLADHDFRVRTLAASLAGGRTDPRLLRRLVALLDDPTPAVRHASLDALTRRAAGSTQALYDALCGTPVLALDELREQDSLAARHDSAATEAALSPQTRQPSGTGAAQTETVAPGLVVVTVPSGRAGSAGTLPRPLRASALPSEQTRTLLLVLRACAASAEQALLPAAARFLADARPDVRAAAVRTLAVLGDRVETFVPALSDPDGRVRAEAVAALGRLGARSLAGRLAAALSDRDHGVRAAAAAALTRLDGAGRLLLMHAMRGPDRFAADAARVALGLPPAGPEQARPVPPDETVDVLPDRQPVHV